MADVCPLSPILLARRTCTRPQAHASLHVIVDAGAVPSVVVRHMRDVCASHGVHHATVQVEDEEAARLACCKAVARHNVSRELGARVCGARRVA